MFTGIITDIGRVDQVVPAGDTKFVIASAYDSASIAIGASICCSGVCLTVIDKATGWFSVTASAETLDCTNLADWALGTPINLERALKVGDELGGHIVSGHVDGVVEIADVAADGDSLRFRFSLPDDLAPYIAPKGSVCLNGVSLTVNEVDEAGFGINIIPHTQEMTTFGAAKTGDRVNLEIDVLARYVARLAQTLAQKETL
ncbi:MAG: riboflavin synthase [Rhodospirillaceae bacterium]|jgi:riboflavin synthase|nr:riboflavin synthase [Rhodospirillaceae bacterium]MBT3495183.1 riboflavin synthase [Rhodospirillaceae bacterium]MBT3781049.1 riboflavin synthase [Rhodospirillaceae bacterium]MBT3977379.1 riboflavin synthase [Rhodospirillaceae bacterium]MBT4565047.1 riboflavin synthase [Rhodospirillaceae bacterium]